MLAILSSLFSIHFVFILTHSPHRRLSSWAAPMEFLSEQLPVGCGQWEFLVGDLVVQENCSACWELWYPLKTVASAEWLLLWGF